MSKTFPFTYRSVVFSGKPELVEEDDAATGNEILQV
jgi:hypothetical protein